RVRLPGTTLRVPEEDPNPWPNKLPRQLENAHGGSMFVSQTSSTIGQILGVADSSASKFNFQKLVGTPRVADLFPDEICENKTQV
ncbi:hypothetical protein MTR67_026894, partial [Solanum verrucosum]